MGKVKRSKRGRVVPGGTIFVSGGLVEIDGPLLRWRFDETHVKHVSVPGSLIDGFIRLHEGSDEEIRHFAQEWGPLRVQLDGSLSRGLEGTDHLDAWRFFSSRAAAVMRLSQELSENRRGEESDWLQLSARDGSTRPTQFWGMGNWARRELVLDDREGFRWGGRLSVSRLKSTLAGEVSEWLERFAVSLRLEWSDRLRWELRLHHAGLLLSAIALQMALSIAGGTLWTCSGCGYPYNRTARKPNVGKPNYCPRCIETPLKVADERRREKIRAARRLYADGASIRKIAKQLGVRNTVRSAAEDTVRRWIEKGK